MEKEGYIPNGYILLFAACFYRMIKNILYDGNIYNCIVYDFIICNRNINDCIIYDCIAFYRKFLFVSYIIIYNLFLK